MKKVFVHAYLSYNLGDDLMVWILCKRYPSVQFCVIADAGYQRVYQDVPNMTVYAYDGRKAKFWDKVWKKCKNTDGGFRKMLMKMSDATIHIGGSSFVQHYDDYSAFLNTDVTMRRLSKRMLAIGMNFGPYTDESYYKQYYELLGRYDGVTFRDSASYRLFEQLPNIKQAADVVFNYGGMHSVSDRTVQEKKQVLFSVIQMDGRDGKFAINQYAEDYKRFMAALAETYLEDGYEVKFISFCGPQGDSEAAKEIISRIREGYKSSVKLYNYETDIEACIRQFDEAQIVVGTRFHSIILGWLKGKKVLPVVYDEKTQNIMNDFEYSVYVKLEELPGIDVKAVRDEIHGMPENQVHQLILDAENQFWAADHILK